MCLDPHVSLPSATTVRRDLDEAYQDAEAKLKTRLQERTARVSIALDAWSAPNRHGFLAVVAYWISDDWTYTNALLGFEYIKGQHSGENFSKILKDLTSKYQIADAIQAVTTDNASNNSTMMSQVVNTTIDGNIEAGIRPQHVPCLAHVLQLGAKELQDGIRITPTNEEFRKDWDAKKEQSMMEQAKKDGDIADPAFALAKVCTWYYGSLYGSLILP